LDFSFFGGVARGGNWVVQLFIRVIIPTGISSVVVNVSVGNIDQTTVASVGLGIARNDRLGGETDWGGGVKRVILSFDGGGGGKSPAGSTDSLVFNVGNFSGSLIGEVSVGSVGFFDWEFVFGDGGDEFGLSVSGVKGDEFFWGLVREFGDTESGSWLDFVHFFGSS